MDRKNSSRGLGSAMIIIIIALVVLGGVYLLKSKTISSFTSAPDTTMSDTSSADKNPSAYQAVFLVNGQVYFGKLSNDGAQFPVLKDIYYLQVQEVLQPVQGKDGKTTQEKQQGVSLVKLGGELHGPTDEMRINRDQILLIENLRADSNVVQAIEEYVKSAAEAAAKAAAAPVAPTPAQ
ncbi:MAG: hypothetical protein Q7R62_01205 [bacterium]|nr:hypothetical protein [bacterium]